MFHVQSPEKPSSTQDGWFLIQACWTAAWAPGAARRVLHILNVRLPLILQRPCHAQPRLTLICAAALLTSLPASGAPPGHDYPTQARVEFVNECIARHGDKLSRVYQCSCVIDRIADALSYDEFVEASAFAKYSGLAGERGGIFRDSDEAKAQAKRYRELEKKAYSDCGLGS